MSKKLLLDLDGVLVDFVSGALKLHKREDIPYRSIVWDFHKMVCPDGQSAFWEPMGFDFWAKLPWTTNGRELLSGLVKTAGWKNICLCTSPCKTVGSIEGKIQWVRDNIPELERNFMVTPVKEFAAGPDRILVDDRDENCEVFTKAGGEAVLVPQPWNELALGLKGNDFIVEDVLEEVRQLWME